MRLQLRVTVHHAHAGAGGAQRAPSCDPGGGHHAPSPAECPGHRESIAEPLVSSAWRSPNTTVNSRPHLPFSHPQLHLGGPSELTTYRVIHNTMQQKMRKNMFLRNNKILLIYWVVPSPKRALVFPSKCFSGFQRRFSIFGLLICFFAPPCPL